MKRRVFGFDLGIASIGWAVVEFDNEYYDLETGEILADKVNGSGEIAQGTIVGCGVRTFPVAENPKDGSSLAAARREKRLARRACRRKARRKKGLQGLFAAKGLVESPAAFTDEICMRQIGGDVWDLRVKALQEKLSKEELLRVLYHLAKHRGFKSIRKAQEENDKDSGKVLSAIRANMALKEDGKSLAQIIVEKAGETGKKRNFSKVVKVNKKGEDVKEADYRNSIPRSEIEAELAMIFTKQKEYGIFTQDLYDDFVKIAFRQRGIKSVGDMVGNCTFEKGEKRSPKEAPTAEFFVAWSKINNLAVYEGDKKRELTPEERQTLFDVLKVTKDIKYKTIRSKVFKGKDIQFTCLNYSPKQKKNKNGELVTIDPEDVLFYNMKGWHKLQSIFKAEYSDIFNDIKKLDKAVTIIATEKEDVKIQEKLQELGYSQEKIDKFLTLSFDKFINLSLKALYKINPYLEKGEKYDKACANAGYDFKEITDKLVNEKGLLLAVIDKEKLTKVPVVNRTIAQFRKLYNAMVRQYGAPDQINIETGRELKKSAEERKKIQKLQEENRDKNQSIKKQLLEWGVKDNGTNITKLRLYNEQQGKSIYSGNEIKIEQLFDDGYVEIDHILPYSRSWNNSQSNKVLVLARENQEKGNQTPFEYIGKSDAKSKEWTDFTSYVTSFASIEKHKKEKLLLETFNEREQEFRDRNANDNSYIALYVKRYLEDGIDFGKSLHTEIKNKVQVRSGNVTAFLRRQWGLEKDRTESDKHHAQDAIVIACAAQGMVQALSKISRKEGVVHTDAVHRKYAIAKPWDNFRNDVLTALEKVFVSRSPRKKASGEIHNETIYTLNEKKKQFEAKNAKSGFYVRGGIAGNGDMLRTDVFCKKNKKGKVQFYLVPIYKSNLGKELPNKAIVANKNEDEWTVIDESFSFMFSLFMDDLIKVQKGETVYFGYYKGVHRVTAGITLEEHDRKQKYEGIGTKTLDSIKKYQVNLLGEYFEVGGEKRQLLTHKK